MAEPLEEPVVPADAPNGADADTIGAPVVASGLSTYDGPAIDIAAELRTSYLGYAMSTIVSRALPDVRDGLKPVQRRILYAMRELGLSPNSRHLKSAKVVGECFVAGTRVATPNGLRRIEELQVGDTVFTQSGVRAVTEAYILPEQPLLDVELSSGRNVFCTPGQQFKVLTSDLSTVWKRGDELVAGDVVITRGGTAAHSASIANPVVSDITVDADLAYLLGFFLADGWVDRDNKRGYHRLSFAATERSLIERIQNTLSRTFGISPAITERGNMYQLRVSDSALNQRLLSAFNLAGKRAETIAVPEFLFTAVPELLYSFVSGFADGDGSVHKDRNLLVLTSIARSFLHDLSVLLFANGIHSRLLPYDKVAGNTEYALEIGSHSLYALGRHLSLAHPVKAERLTAILARGEYQPEKAANVPYLGTHLLAEFSAKHLGGGWYEGRNGAKVRSGLKYANGVKIRYSADVADTFTVSMDALNTVGLLDKMNAIGSQYLPLLQSWQENDISFHRVRAVRPSVAQVTYDIQVEEEHEFIANGMVVHNCMGNFHPHGDAALYGTMVRMAQPFSLRYPMVDGQGNFGSVDDDPPAAMRYCVTGESLTVTDAGLVPMGAMSDTEDMERSVLSLNGHVHSARKWFDCGVFPVRKVRTRRGYEITGTMNHPLLVCVPGSDKRTTLAWKTIENLEVGDYVVLDRSENLWSEALVDLTALHPELPADSYTKHHELPTRLSDDLAFLLGALVAEGTCRPSCIEFCNLPGDFADAFAMKWAGQFGDCRLHTFRRDPVSYGKKPFLQMQVVSKQVIAFLNALGLQGRSADRLIPDAVLRSPQSVVGAFLRGLFEGDGAVERSGNSLLRVNLSAKSRAILRQVQTVLLRFGIVSTLNADQSRGMYRLLVVGEENLQRFAQKIGFVSAAKQDALASALATYTSGHVLSQTDFVPYLADFVRANAKRGNREWLGKNNFDRPDRLEKALPRLAQALDADAFADVAQIAQNRYLFELVTAIEDAGEQNVYSIRVDSDCHSFVANGFVNHNTEARLTAVAMEMMEDIEKDTVDFIPTYDNERREPSVLPGKFPNLICNGGTGIAVGMATNMAPHNLREICDASTYLLEHPDASIEQLMQYVPGPDFPTAGLILGSKGIKSAYHTGRGQVTMQAKTTIEPMDGGKSMIVISELPYQVIKKKLEEQIGDLVKDKKIDGITAVRDYSDKTGMRLVVELRRDVMPQKILNYLLKHTPLRLNFGVIMLSLVDSGRGPKTLSLKSVLQEYLDHRRDIITRRTRFELARAKARAHILEGLQIAVQFLDEVIQIIRSSNSTENARLRLIERFAFSGLQAEAILNMQLRQLTALEQDKIEGEFKDLLKESARLEDILMDPRRVNAMIKADLKYLKDKFGDDRRTRIIPTEAEEINIEDLIADEEMLITITRDGYIKRLDFDTFRSQKRGGRGVSAGKTKEEDNFEHLFRASTHDYILFFTDRGRVYRLKAFEVPQASRQAMGTAVINLIQIQPDEKITATVPVRDFRTAEGFLLMVTERGEVKRTPISEYGNLRANGLITFDLEENDSLKWVKHTPGDAEVILTTVRGMAIRYTEDKVPSRGRAAGGVRGITLEGEDDRVVAADVVIGDADAQELLVVSELGLGKRTPLAAYRSQGRGGKGLKTMDLTDRTGCLVVACVVSKESEPNLRLMIVTANGVMIRMKAEEIRTTQGRSTQGVRLINLVETDRVKTAEVIDVAKGTEEAEG